MGAVLCCMRQPSTEHEQPENDQLISNCSQYVSPVPSTEQHVKSANTTERSHLDTPENKYTMIECMTLQECLLNSPKLNPHSHVGDEIQIVKHLPIKFYPSSPEGSQDFFTPRMSFSADRLEIIDEKYEYEDNLSANSMSRSASGKLGKKVRFRLPQEADIYFYYTPKETFEE